MSKPGDQTPFQEPDPNSFDPDTAQTLPEGAFDKTLVEEGVAPAPVDENATMVGYEPAASMPDAGTAVGLAAPAASEESNEVDPNATLPVGMLVEEPETSIPDDATMVALDVPAASGDANEVDPNATLPVGMLVEEPETSIPDDATMVALDVPVASGDAGEVDPNATLPDGALAAPADDDLSLRTIMLDDPALNAPSEIDFDKTLPDGALAMLADEDFAGKTLVMDTFGTSEADTEKTLPEGAFDAPVDAGATLLVDDTGAISSNDDFGKTLQADAYGKTLATDGTIALDDDIDAKTIVGTDSAAEQNVSASAGTKVDPNLQRSGAAPLDSRATSTGGKTSVEGTQVFGANEGDGIDKDSLNVATRTITGLHYGLVPKVDFKLVKQLGEGGMGVVYVARQQSLGREVVFKTLKPMAESQASKLKASGTMNSVNKHRTDMFLSEAVVTADLFHPNIVPIYELAKAPDGSLFYTMKWVRGDGWHNRLKLMTLEENLEVLMKVSDAMGFAHSRNIANRDLKPENVMLGGYGETIVLDWGLALPFGEGKGRLPISTTAGLGSGTPAYMPPELITGPLARIGPACDIYLLGAMLFEVITGLPPHDFTIKKSAGTAGSVSAGAKMAEIRRVVVDNVIRETDPKFKGELLDIAMKAMATKPEDRYRTVADFQKAIRDYEKHALSHTLAARAKELTTVPAALAAPLTAEGKPTAATPSVGYKGYQDALALYNESLREWTGNDVARAGLTETQLNFAKLALKNGDFDLGLQVLDTNADSHVETRTLLVKAKEEREGRVRRMKVLKWTAIGLLIGFAGVSAFAAKGQFDLTKANKQKIEAEQQATAATIAKKEAEEAAARAELLRVKAENDAADAKKSKLLAEAAQKKAKEEADKADALAKEANTLAMKADAEAKLALVAKMNAEDATMKAEVARVAAEKAGQKAQESAIAAKKEQAKADYRAGLADASRSFFEGSYVDTRKKLISLKKDFAELCGPEWEQLMNAASAPQVISMAKPVESIGLSRNGRKLVTGDSDGHIVVYEIDADGMVLDEATIRLKEMILDKHPIRRFALGSGLRVVAMSPNGDEIAAAGKDGTIRVWNLSDPGDQPRISLKGHTQWVNALKFSSDGLRLVSGSDDSTVCLWSVAKSQLLVRKKVLHPVQCVDWSLDGRWLVAGTSSAPDNVSGVAYSWEVKSIEDQLTLVPLRQFQVLPVTQKKATDATGVVGEKEKVKQNRGVVAIALTDDGKYAVSNGPAAELYLWQVNPVTTGQKKNSLKADISAAIKLGVHSNRVERVRSVAFAPDSKRMLVAGDDGAISIWERKDDDSRNMPFYQRQQVVYGHGGPVRGCLLLPQNPDLIISGSYDQKVHRWDLTTYFKSREPYDAPKKSATPVAFRPVDSEVSVLDKPLPPESDTCGSEGPSESGTKPGTDALVSVLDTQAPSAAASPFRLIPSDWGQARLPRWQQVSSPKPVPREVAAAVVAIDEPRKSVRLAAGINPKNNDSVAHTDSVLSAVFSRDGKFVLSASRDQTARAWTTETGRPILTSTGQASSFDDNQFKEGHDYDLFTMRFFSDGKRLLTSGFDGEMRIWDSEIGNQKSFGRELGVLPETGMYGVVDISRDGRWILTAGRKTSADRKKTAEGKVQAKDDNKYEAQAQLWNIDDVITKRRIEPRFRLDNVHRFRVTTVAIWPDNSRLLTGDREGKVVLWNAANGKQVGESRILHSGEVVKSQILGDGSRLLTAGVDRRVVLWKVVQTNSEFVLEKIREFKQEGMVVNLAVSPLEDRFISVIRISVKKTKDAQPKEFTTKVSLWNIETGREQVIQLPTPNARRIANLSDLDATRERERDRPPFPAWAANGTQAIITTSEGLIVNGATTSEGAIHFYDFQNNAITLTKSLRVDKADGAEDRAEPFSAILLPNEDKEPRHLLTQTHTAAFLWDINNGENLVSFRPQGPVFSAGYSADARFVVTGGRSVRIFDADERHEIQYGRQLHKLEYPHNGMATSVEFTPVKDSYRFLTTSHDETAKIWEWDPIRQVAQLQHTLIGHVGPVRCGTWSANGSLVLTVGHDSRPRVWSFPANGPDSTVLDLPADTRPDDFQQLCGAFSWDGQFVAIGARNIQTGESLGWIWNLKPAMGAKPKVYATVRGHGLGGINSVAFLPGDDRLLTGGADGTARLWDWQKSGVDANGGNVVEADFLISLVRRTEDKQATTHRGAVTSVRVSSDGNIVTASSDGTVLIWPK
ncbi:MAG: protein kinase domain-containing protein [Planctomycetaceae bacterium]